ncbi:MAG: hypothetical protein HYV35_07030, partial [Lentisphaerae bacterium]|nr:hypothetical protein [Lentisphaerota bacterium]
FVLQDGSTYKMWYSGWGGTPGRYSIYYATSTNGLTWTKLDNNVPADSNGSSTNGKIPLGTAGTGDDTYVLSPFVLKEGEGPTSYRMWYSGHDGANYRIYYATSSNGLEWTKYDNTVPADSNGSSTNGKIPRGTAGKGDAAGAFSPAILRDGNSDYKMWYTGYDGTNYRLYYATSSNGLELIPTRPTAIAASAWAQIQEATTTMRPIRAWCVVRMAGCISCGTQDTTEPIGGSTMRLSLPSPEPSSPSNRRVALRRDDSQGYT